MDRFFHRLTILSLLAVLFVVPLAFTWWTSESFYVPKRFVLEALVVVVGMSIYLWNVWSRESALHFSSLPAVAVAPLSYAAWCGLSLVWAKNLYAVHSYLLLLSQVGLCLFVLLLARDQRTRLLLVRVACAAAFLVALLGVLQYFGLNYEQGIKWTRGVHMEKLDIYSTVGNPNFLAAYLISLLPLATVGAFGLLDDAGAWKWFYRATAALSVLCLVYTRTKGAWIGAVVSGLYLLWMVRSGVDNWVRGKRLFPMGIALLLLGAGLYLSGSISWILEEVSSLQRGHITVSGRLFLWQVTLQMIMDRPLFGVGWGNYRAYFQEYQGRFLDGHPDYVSLLETQGSAESSHNEYLEIATETGLVGLVLFFWVIVAVFGAAWRIYKERRNDTGGIVLASSAGLLAVLVHALFVFPLHLADTGALFWALIGLIGACCMPENRALPRERTIAFLPRTWVARAGVTAATVMVAGFLIFEAFRPVMASALHKKAWEAMYYNNYPAVISLAGEGIRWSRANDELYLLSGAAKYQSGLVRESIEDYEHAYKIYPDYMILFNIGLAYKKLGMTEEAIRYLEQSVYVRPNLAQGYNELRGILASRGDNAGVAALEARMKKMNVSLD